MQDLEQRLEQRRAAARSARRSSPRRAARGLPGTRRRRRRRRRPRQRLDELRLAGRHAVAAARQLQAVRHVVDDRVAERAQDREGAHVDDEVVVAEAEPALGDDHPLVAGAVTFSIACRMSAGREELSLLDVDDASGLRGGDEQIGLPREERRDLQHVGDLRRRGAPAPARGCRSGSARRRLLAHAREHAQAFVEARTAERLAPTCGSPCRTTP